MKNAVFVVDQDRLDGGVDAVALGDLHSRVGKGHGNVKDDLLLDRLTPLDLTAEIDCCGRQQDFGIEITDDGGVVVHLDQSSRFDQTKCNVRILRVAKDAKAND